MSDRKPHEPKYDMITVGDATIDSFYKIHDAEVRAFLHNDHPMLCISYADKIAVDAFDQVVAGNSANVAVGSARLGLKTAIYCVVGDDPSGEKIIQAYKDDEVATEYVKVDKNSRSNSSAVISFQGERSILVYHEPHVWNLPDLAPSKWLYLSSMRVDLEKINHQVVRYHKETGTKIGYNPGTYQLMLGADGMKDILQVTEMLFINKEEASLLTGKKPFPMRDLLKATRELGPKLVAITDGLDGAYAFDGEEFYFIPLFPGARVESTGAGDSFATAVMAALIQGETFPDALRWGPINSASVVHEIGPMRGLLHLDAMQRKLKDHPQYQTLTLDDYEIKRKELEKIVHG